MLQDLQNATGGDHIARIDIHGIDMQSLRMVLLWGGSRLRGRASDTARVAATVGGNVACSLTRSFLVLHWASSSYIIACLSYFVSV